jgi:hypothetical protein
MILKVGFDTISIKYQKHLIPFDYIVKSVFIVVKGVLLSQKVMYKKSLT